MADKSDSKSARLRIEEAIREIGVLLIALAPLDAAFGDDKSYALLKLLIFAAMGATLFVFALWLERSRVNARTRR